MLGKFRKKLGFGALATAFIRLSCAGPQTPSSASLSTLTGEEGVANALNSSRKAETSMAFDRNEISGEVCASSLRTAFFKHSKHQASQDAREPFKVRRMRQIAWEREESARRFLLRANQRQEWRRI